MKTKYYSDAENGVVKAKVIPKFEQTVFGEITSKCKKSTIALIAMFSHEYGFKTKESFSAQAQCIDKEAYDENHGKGLAQQKAIYKFHNAMARQYRRLIDLLRIAIDDISELERQHNIKSKRIEEDYKKYYLGE